MHNALAAVMGRPTRIGRILAVVTLFTLPLAALAADPAAPDDRRVKAELAKLQLAAAAADRQDCPTAAKLAGQVADRKPGLLPPKLMAAAYGLAASCEITNGDRAAAYRHAMAGTALDDSSDELWRFRFGIELYDSRYDAAVRTVEAMSQGRGAALNALPMQWFYQIDNALRGKDQAVLRRRLLSVIGNGGYIPDEPGANVDDFRLRYAGVLGDADAGTIASIIAQIDDASTLMAVSLDPRFRKVVADPDIRQHVERNLTAMRAATRSNPGLIGPLLRVATYLRVLGRPAEALTTLDTIKDRIADPAAFADSAEKTVWWWDERARAFEMLGRHEDEIAALRAGAENKENGAANVSQVINLAQTQVDIGQPTAALATLAVFDGAARNVSPFGAMQVRFTRACALSLIGKAADARADVQFVRDHEKDAPRTVTELLLCMGDLDGAAASFVRRLDDPDTRVDALLQLSDYDDPPVPTCPGPLLKDLPAIKARPDVQAAIVRAGGTRRFHVQRVNF